MKESNYAKKALPEWQKKHPEARVFRNNSGMAWQGDKSYEIIDTKSDEIIKKRILENPRPIFFGVGLPVKNEKTGRIKQKGGGDRIGWESKTLCDIVINDSPTGCCSKLTCDECGFKNKKIAIFLNLEVKTKNVPESKEQKQFREMVIAAGGISIILREE